MDIEEAIHTRRTVKAFGNEPVSEATLDELFELARWAPNHCLTNPWRFRVLGPASRERLRRVAGEQAAAAAPEGADREQIANVAATKLDRAPTLVAVSAMRHADPVQHEEDVHATACAAYIVLLAAHGRGLAGYWRTPAVLRTDQGLAALGIGADEQVLGLLYLGDAAAGAPPATQRASVEEIVTRLD